MAEANANVPTGDADVSAKIVRACRSCGGKREIDTDCESCGLTEAPEVIDLGVIAAQRSNPVDAMRWNLIGVRLADRRIRKANQAIGKLCD